MSKAYILDFELLEEHGLSIGEFLCLVRQQRYFSDNILDDLEKKQFIKFHPNSKYQDFELREKAKLLLELVSIDKVDYTKKKVIKKSSRLIDAELEAFIVPYRNLWRGKKAGSMGSESSCKEKMSQWMQENPSYSKEDIMKAAKIYIDSVNDYTYLQQADHFIKKTERGHTSSRLSAFIEEINERPVTDWTTNLS